MKLARQGEPKACASENKSSAQGTPAGVGSSPRGHTAALPDNTEGSSKALTVVLSASKMSLGLAV